MEINSSIKKIIGAAIFYTGLAHMYSVFKKNDQVTVLMYHRVASEKQKNLINCNVFSSSEASFKQQMKYLAEKCNVISFDDFYEACKTNKKLPKNSVIITFDDGYKDNYLFAYPILKKYKLPATIFLTTGHINKSNLFWWDKITYIIENIKLDKLSISGLCDLRLPKNKKLRKQIVIDLQEKVKKCSESEKLRLIAELEKKLDHKIPSVNNLFLSWKEVREMSKNKISFGAHTVTHPILTRVTPKIAEEEITRSKKKIEMEINKKVTVFAYPNGGLDDMNVSLDRFLKKQGFHFAVSTIVGRNKIHKDMFIIKRIGVECNDDLRLFKIKISGMLNSLAPIYSKIFR